MRPRSRLVHSKAASGIQACDDEPFLRTTADGLEFVRTPDSCFEDLAAWPYQTRYVELDGLRQAYVEEGASDGPVVLLLHGQPTWSYLYRTMIPTLADAGFRVIAMDHLGLTMTPPYRTNPNSPGKKNHC